MADRIFGLRLDEADKPRSRIIVGRTDDVAELARELGSGHVRHFRVENVGKLAAFLKRIVDLVKRVRL